MPEERNRSTDLDGILGDKFPVHAGGFIRVVDYMGNEDSIVEAARCSYGKGTRKVSEDKNLLRYLMRHAHSTPIEMAEIKFHVFVEMDTWRQWIRHRTACLTGDNSIQMSNGDVLSVEDIFQAFYPTTRHPDFDRSYFKDNLVLCVNEETHEITETRILGVYSSGMKRVFEVELANGTDEHYSSKVTMSADHQCLTEQGWQTLRDIMSRYADGASILTVGNGDGPGDKTKAQFSDVESIRDLGNRATYDLEVNGPWHNFSANGMVVHNSVNEYSTRYSEAIDDIRTTLPGEWRVQSITNKQGSGSHLPEAEGLFLTSREAQLHELSRQVYKERLHANVAREQARKDLPLSNYTTAYWKIDLHNLLHFLSLRMDTHAQIEIRRYADVLGYIVSKWVPNVWEAFNDYNFRRNAVLLTRLDAEVIRGINRGADMDQVGKDLGWISYREDGSLKTNRERDESVAKLEGLGFSNPWKHLLKTAENG